MQSKAVHQNNSVTRPILSILATLIIGTSGAAGSAACNDDPAANDGTADASSPRPDAAVPDSAAPDSDVSAGPQVAGFRWRGGCSPSQSGGTFERLQLDATGAPSNSFSLQVFADAACSLMLYEVGNTSTSTIGNPVGGGAFELNVTFKSLFAVAHEPEGTRSRVSPCVPCRTV